jgi:hypothetical protein
MRAAENSILNSQFANIGIAMIEYKYIKVKYKYGNNGKNQSLGQTGFKDRRFGGFGSNYSLRGVCFSGIAIRLVFGKNAIDRRLFENGEL